MTTVFPNISTLFFWFFIISSSFLFHLVVILLLLTVGVNADNIVVGGIQEKVFQLEKDMTEVKSSMTNMNKDIHNIKVDVKTAVGKITSKAS